MSHPENEIPVYVWEQLEKSTKKNSNCEIVNLTSWKGSYSLSTISYIMASGCFGEGGEEGKKVGSRGVKCWAPK